MSILSEFLFGLGGRGDLLISVSVVFFVVVVFKDRRSLCHCDKRDRGGTFDQKKGGFHWTVCLLFSMIALEEAACFGTNFILSKN